MIKYHPRRGHALAFGGIFRPDLRDGRVEIQHSSLCQQVDTKRGRRLRRRPDDADRVLFPGSTGLGIGDPSPEVDHTSATMEDADRCPDFCAFGEIGDERIGDRSEFARA